MDEDAKIINGGKYNGMDRYEARKAIVADLEAEGYLVKIEEHAHNVGICYRCGTTVEPITSPQWFVKMAPLAEESLKVVADGQIKFVPERFVKIYNNWMTNAHDWCISRQLCGAIKFRPGTVPTAGILPSAADDPNKSKNAAVPISHGIRKCWTTWFSSALWPFGHPWCA
jgi:valyl-tRNA synthetase